MNQRYSYLKKLVSELEEVFLEQGGLLDVRAREDLLCQFDDLKKKIEEGEAKNIKNVQFEVFMLMANLLSVLTNVWMLIR